MALNNFITTEITEPTEKENYGAIINRDLKTIETQVLHRPFVTTNTLLKEWRFEEHRIRKVLPIQCVLFKTPFFQQRL